MQVNSDWSIMGTAAHLEQQLTGFKFKGPGFYLDKTEFALVVPVDPSDTVWSTDKDPDKLWRFYAYGVPCEQSIFGSGTPPVRQDNR